MHVRIVHAKSRDLIGVVDVPMAPPPGSYIRTTDGSKWRVRQLWFDIPASRVIVAVLPFLAEDVSIST